MTRRRRRAPCLMVQGTGSGVGKSVLTAALCRLFTRAGYRVAPFKSQNMALNAAVALGGGEIGRAQAAQAEAAQVEASVDMNPILLKPESDQRSQLIVRGAVWGPVDFREYAAMQPALLPVVAASLDRVRRQHDLVVIEGAGSPAEINLRDSDIVNMRIAHLADAAVLLLGDIDRGGLFAALVGTWELLTPDDRRRIAGFIVNKFRGDIALLESGLAVLTARTRVPVLGVVPFIEERLVPAEDSLDLDHPVSALVSADIDIAVIRLPHIANFDDFEPLAAEPGVRVRFVRSAGELMGADLVVLPGSKSTMADLEWLRARGLAEPIRAAARSGQPVLGICGGYQMLGATVLDPDRIEGSTEAARGLGLLPLKTKFAASKTTRRVEATGLASSSLFREAAGRISAYEIHAGRTEPAAGRRSPRPVFGILTRGGRPVSDVDGAVDAGGNVEGTYLHGVFANGQVRRAVLGRLAGRRGMRPDPRWGAKREDPYDRLADIVGGSLDMSAVARLVALAYPRAATGR
jgi:adenosylcobyric acid synthase